jgi:hypothetical protein
MADGDIVLRTPGATPGDISLADSGLNMWINVAGTQKQVTEAYVNVSGTWKAVTEIDVNVSGTWKAL